MDSATSTTVCGVHLDLEAIEKDGTLLIQHYTGAKHKGYPYDFDVVYAPTDKSGVYNLAWRAYPDTWHVHLEEFPELADMPTIGGSVLTLDFNIKDGSLDQVDDDGFRETWDDVEYVIGQLLEAKPAGYTEAELNDLDLSGIEVD